MRKLAAILIAISLISMWGCSKDPAQPVESDEQAIKDLIESIEESDMEDYFYSNLDDENENALFKPLGDYLLKPIFPIRFGRIGIRPLIRDINVELTSDNEATVTFTKVLRGNFVILAAYTPEEQPVEIYRVDKPMVHEFQRIAHFEKINDDNTNGRRNWKLVDFSMALGKSVNDNETGLPDSDLDIIYLKVEYDGEVVEISDPLEYFQTRENVFTFERGTEVTLTVRVENTLPAEEKVTFPNEEGATELVRLHFARHRFRRFHGIRRFDFVRKIDNTTNEYMGTWTVGDWVRVHHAAIDIINNGTIFDDDAEAFPYRSVTWSTPYKVIPPQN
jgi:hypothetical protein